MTRKARRCVPQQCPKCEMWFSEANKKSRHIAGKLCWGDGVPILNEETKAIWLYWKEKKQRKTPPSKQFLLSATEMVRLFSDAGITAKDIGKGSHQYALARHNDTGHYEMGNCRFITARANTQERSETNNVESKIKKTHTPHGTFKSLKEAAENHGLNHSVILYRVGSPTEKMKEYYYVE